MDVPIKKLKLKSFFLSKSIKKGLNLLFYTGLLESFKVYRNVKMGKMWAL